MEKFDVVQDTLGKRCVLGVLWWSSERIVALLGEGRLKKRHLAVL